MTSAHDIEDAAVLWRLKQDEPGWTAADQAALDTWLDEAVAHRVAWLRIQYGWEQVGRLASLKAPPEPAAKPRRRQTWRPQAMAAALALTVALGTAGVALEIGKPGHAYATDVGGRRTVALQDGSRVELNTASKVRADVDEDRRVVWLEKGEAYFDIKHDGRPFTVYAGDRRIVVLGTKFSVRRDGKRVQVAVAEGRVRVELARPEAATRPAVVTQGDLVVAEAASTLVTAKAPRRVANELAWRQGLVVFDNSALIEAAAEFNRYNDKKIVIEDPQAAATMISGSFEARNVEAFARLLRQAMRLNVEDVDEEIRVSS